MSMLKGCVKQGGLRNGMVAVKKLFATMDLSELFATMELSHKQFLDEDGTFS